MKLKCNPNMLRQQIAAHDWSDELKDAAVAHAYDKAIAEARDTCFIPGATTTQLIDWVENRAAEILRDEFGVTP